MVTMVTRDANELCQQGYGNITKKHKRCEGTDEL